MQFFNISLYLDKEDGGRHTYKDTNLCKDTSASEDERKEHDKHEKRKNASKGAPKSARIQFIETELRNQTDKFNRAQNTEAFIFPVWVNENEVNFAAVNNTSDIDVDDSNTSDISASNNNARENQSINGKNPNQRLGHNPSHAQNATECIEHKFAEYLDNFANTKYQNSCIFAGSKHETEEITFNEFKIKLSKSEKNDFVEDDKLIHNQLDTRELSNYYDLEFKEEILSPNTAQTNSASAKTADKAQKGDPHENANNSKQKSDSRESASNNKAQDAIKNTPEPTNSTSKPTNTKIESTLISDSLNEELKRICAGHKTETAPRGIPIQYLIETDDEETAKVAIKALTNCLYENNRIKSKRLTTLSKQNYIGKRELDVLYHINAGCTLAINAHEFDLDGSNLIHSNMNTLKKVCDYLSKYQSEIQCIFVLPVECTRMKNFLLDKFNTTNFIEIKEVATDATSAKKLLDAMAREHNVEPDEKLYATLNEGEKYLTKELRRKFNAWYARWITTHAYPQYSKASLHSLDKENKGAVGSAYEELQDMIGLERVKKIIDNIVRFNKIQTFMENAELTPKKLSMHMMFTGNPGTAKTTVARLFAKIMRDNSLLSSGHIVEAGRSDLVGEYVGSTAPRVKEVFEDAKGGVLFIDEAYSLVDDRDGMYGDEAINTIVQEMENMRDEVVVIFAGYPEKMKAFLNKNPGLKSRIAHHVSFDDYTPNELCDIARLMAKKQNLTLDAGAQEKIANICSFVYKEENFGNGRYVRQLIENAIMLQSVRLSEQDYAHMTDAELTTIIASDIEPVTDVDASSVSVGFC